jgi:hypothetical protein
VRLDGGGLEPAAALGDDGLEVGERGEVPVDDGLVDQGPEMLDDVSMLPLYAWFLLRSGAGTVALMRSSSSASIRTSQMRCPPRVAILPRSRPWRSQR